MINHKLREEMKDLELKKGKHKCKKCQQKVNFLECGLNQKNQTGDLLPEQILTRMRHTKKILQGTKVNQWRLKDGFKVNLIVEKSTEQNEVKLIDLLIFIFDAMNNFLEM